MGDDINVIVVKRKGRNLNLRYTDPVTGQKVEKSSGTKNRSQAVKYYSRTCLKRLDILRLVSEESEHGMEAECERCDKMA